MKRERARAFLINLENSFIFPPPPLDPRDFHFRLGAVHIKTRERAAIGTLSAEPIARGVIDS